MTHSAPYNRRTILAFGFATSAVVLGSGGQVVTQQGPTKAGAAQTRIPLTATGQAAIGRTRGRLQFGFDDRGLRFGAPIYLRLIKDLRRLEVWVLSRRQTYVRLRTYRLCGSNAPIGPRGPTSTPQQPEGFYVLGPMSLRPPRIAYLGIDLGWPNRFDQAQGWRGPTSLMQAGCAGEPHFGLTDQDMEEVYTLVHGALAGGQNGVPLHIFPFGMGRINMMANRGNANIAFWRQLEPAWQAFERTKKPPQVTVLGRRYVVRER